MDNRERIFIIGCGTSLDGFKFNRLRNEKTLAVNHATHHIPFEPSYFLTADSGVIRKAAEENFWGMSKATKKIVVINPKEHKFWKRVEPYVSKYDIWLKPYRTDTGDIGFTFDKFVTGKNSGFCALQYAVLLRFKEIYLLGFDMMRGRHGRKYFWSLESGGLSPYSIFLKHFIHGLATIHSKSRIKVYLGSRPSLLEPYMKFVDVEEMLK